MNFPGQHAIQSLDHTPHGPKMFFEKIFCFCLLHQLKISIEVSIGLSGILGFYCLLLSFAFEERVRVMGLLSSVRCNQTLCFVWVFDGLTNCLRSLLATHGDCRHLLLQDESDATSCRIAGGQTPSNEWWWGRWTWQVQWQEGNAAGSSWDLDKRRAFRILQRTSGTDSKNGALCSSYVNDKGEGGT